MRWRTKLAMLAGLAGACVAPWLLSADDGTRGEASAEPVPEWATRPAVSIQEDLDEDGYCRLGPTTYWIDEPIRIGSAQVLEGSGPRTIIRMRGEHEYAIEFGGRERYLSAAYLRDLRVMDAGVLVRQMSNHSQIERVWIQNAPGDGLHVEAAGELMTMRHVVAWGCGGDGISVTTTGATGPNTGMRFAECTSSNNRGYGLALRTRGWSAILARVQVTDSVIQANARGGEAEAEILIEGFVQRVHFANLWSENVQSLVNSVPRCILLRKKWEWAGERWYPRRPAEVVIDGLSALHLCPVPVRAEACHGLEIGRSVTMERDAVIEVAADRWDVDPAKLRGEWFSANPDRVVQVTLPTAPPESQPVETIERMMKQPEGE